jgi:ATP-dependent protease HslVU (ClpYQ) ATPase subunit
LKSEDFIINLETKCESLEGTPKVEKEKNKKERQKAEKASLENHEITVKVEKVEMNEKSVEISNIPIFNKFETLQNIVLKVKTAKGLKRKIAGPKQRM